MIAPARQRGVALITAILITALISSVALSLAWDNALDMRRTMTLLYRDQAVQVAIGAESWIQSILRDDLAETDTDHLGEIWASELPGLPVQSDVVQGELFGSIEDLQGRFNVNNLVDQSGEVDELALEQFRRLLIVLELDPSFAPGTGTPVCGGLSSHQAMSILRGLRGIDVVGMDIVEVAPAYDVGEITALAGAHLAMEMLYLYARRSRR